MILALEISGIVVVCAIIFAVIEYRADTNADIKTLDKLEHKLMMRHLKEVNPK